MAELIIIPYRSGKIHLFIIIQCHNFIILIFYIFRSIKAAWMKNTITHIQQNTVNKYFIITILGSHVQIW